MVDRDDDLRIGVKSTAILFGRHDLRIIALLQVATLALLVWVGWLQQLAWPFYVSLLGAALLFVQQRLRAGQRQREACFQAFLANNRVGGLIFAGILLAMALS